MSALTAGDAIVDFYSGGRDDRGRTLDDVLGWSDDKLEAVHDYIQWLFPTRHPSSVNPFAPIVTAATIGTFAHEAPLRERLRRAFDRMLLFYGLERNANGAITPEPRRFDSRARVWLHPGNHNHLRLTRIMESLAALGLRGDPVALQQCLVDRVASEHGGVSAVTLNFWKHAVD